jgi:hypothetical protein
MWVEGCCENIEGYWEDGEDYNAILIYGNHKGCLKFELIVFHNK